VKIATVLLLATCLLISSPAFAMEQDQNEPITDSALEEEIYLQEQTWLQEAITQSLTELPQPKDHKIKWKHIPPEVKAHILSFVPDQDYKNILLINKECKVLTEEQAHPATFAEGVINYNLKKAIGIYAHAIKKDNKRLLKAFLSRGVVEKTVQAAGLQNVSAETYAQALMQLHPQAAQTIFVKAASKGTLALVTSFLAAGIPIDKPSSASGITALMEASDKGHLEIVRILLEHHAKPDVKKKYGITALLCAASSGHEDIVKLLIDHGANVNARNASCYTPLINATYEGHSGVVEILLEHGADANAKTGYSLSYLFIDGHTFLSGYSALAFAVENGDKAIVASLLAHHADIENRNCFNNTPLIQAAEKGRYEIAEMLIAAGANVNAKNTKEITALMLAANRGYLQIVELLIANNARVNAKDAKGKTVLYYALEALKKSLEKDDAQEELCPISDNDYNKIVQLLLAKGATAEPGMSCVVS
jgi:ankyrin repeat protein